MSPSCGDRATRCARSRPRQAFGPLPRQPEPAAPVELADLLQEGPLPEFESALVLERYGVPLAPRRRAASPEEAAAAAAELGFPVVVKVDGPAHKAAQNGVVLGLGDEDGVRGATQRLGGRVLVASQAEGGAEAFCGMTRDPDFGPVLAVGLGGPCRRVAFSRRGLPRPPRRGGRPAARRRGARARGEPRRAGGPRGHARRSRPPRRRPPSDSRGRREPFDPERGRRGCRRCARRRRRRKLVPHWKENL